MKQQQQVCVHVDNGTKLCRNHVDAERWLVATEYGHVYSVREIILLGECDLCADEQTPEEAWEFVAVYAGVLAGRSVYWNEEKEKAYRREAYVILGKAHVRITPDVKDRVRNILDAAREVDGAEHAYLRDKVLGL